MENINTLKANLSAIGDAIRGKLAVENKYRIEDMPAAINSISSSVEPCIISGSLLVSNLDPSSSTPHNDWDKIKNLIDYENVYELISIFQGRQDLKIREVEEFLSHKMPNITNMRQMALNTTFIDSDIATHVFDLTLDSPNCTNYADLFSDSNIYHLKLTITEHNAFFVIYYVCVRCYLLRDIEIKGPGLNHATSLASICYDCTSLETATIGDNDTNYSKVSSTEDMFEGCSNLKTLTIKGVNALPLSSTASIPSTIESIKVPARLVNTYKNGTNWSSFAKKISAI